MSLSDLSYVVVFSAPLATCNACNDNATNRTPAPSESWGGVRKGLLVASPGQSRHSERSQGLTGVSLEVSNLAQPANIAHSAVKSAVKSSPEDTNNQPPLASWTQSR